jgi:hypothetical protein
MDEEQIKRWDIHTERQVAVTKAAVAAVTILNSGSWLALLSQIGNVTALDGSEGVVGRLFLCWGTGAFLGTLTWFFVYLNVLSLGQTELTSGESWLKHTANFSLIAGLTCCLAAVGLFGWGVILLSSIFA